MNEKKSRKDSSLSAKRPKNYEMKKFDRGSAKSPKKSDN